MNYNLCNEATPSNLVLASTSQIRRELLARLGIDFVVIPADLDETPYPSETPKALVKRLSRAKAEAVRSKAPEAFVLGSDQVAVCAGHIASKPGNRTTAIKDLQRYSGNTVSFYTGLALYCPQTPNSEPRTLWHCDHTRVVFRALSTLEIERYIDRDQPFHCAGAFKMEALGVSLFERIDNQDPTALLGLPLIALCSMLRQAGFKLP